MTSTMPSLSSAFSFSFDNPAFTARNLRNADDEPTTLQSHHRRVELQSPQDLLYLRDNVRRAAVPRIESVVSAGREVEAGSTTTAAQEEEEVKRKEVAREIDTWITELFTATLPNISINGLDGEDPSFSSLLLDSLTSDPNALDSEGNAKTRPEEYENYDTRLAGKITNLYSTIERLNLELADTRRSAVKKAAGRFQQQWEKQGVEMEDALEASRQLGVDGEERQEGVVQAVREGLWFGNDGEGRQEEVKETWKSAIEGLGRVGRDLESVKERAERARRVVIALEGAAGTA